MTSFEDPRRRMLLHRARYRGFKEADIVIGQFAEDRLAGMSEIELDEFERLIAVPDQDLYGWIMKREPAPTNYQGPVLEALQAFPVAEAVKKITRGE